MKNNKCTNNVVSCSMHAARMRSCHAYVVMLCRPNTYVVLHPVLYIACYGVGRHGGPPTCVIRLAHEGLVATATCSLPRHR